VNPWDLQGSFVKEQARNKNRKTADVQSAFCLQDWRD
jgi:hypothetical protein